ncbi:MAG TPA: zf-HC2 domain-containing protein [Thermoanaerobaculia bacterium]|nr:zf-HC2 domain-containing protein [Thermoanaerobaculia bacterium]
MTGHYDERALQEYLDHPESFPGRAALEQHLERCDACRALLDELRAFEATLSADAVWEMTDSGSAAEAPEALRALAELLANEDRDAERLLAPLIASPAAFRRANVTAIAEMRTAGIVRRLCAESRALRERQPMHALVLADAAIAIADQLSQQRYPSPLLDELRGSGWFERANVLRYLGRYPEALDALAIAARAYSRAPVPVFSGAMVDYTRAVIFAETDRLDQALRLARKSARVFRQFGDDERFVHAKMVEACVRFHQDQFTESRALFASLVNVATNIGSPETLARLYADVANCDIELSDFASAETYFARALSLYEATGNESGRIRTRWNLGTLRLAAGDLAEGLARLREARREFEAIGARTDAALVALEMAEVLLATGKPRGAHEAAELCSGLAESFAAVGMESHALTALAWLRAAFQSGRATPALVQHVRQYIRTRPDQDGRAFTPPPGI